MARVPSIDVADVLEAGRARVTEDIATLPASMIAAVAIRIKEV